jgi:hypothetical protein
MRDQVVYSSRMSHRSRCIRSLILFAVPRTHNQTALKNDRLRNSAHARQIGGWGEREEGRKGGNVRQTHCQTEDQRVTVSDCEGGRERREERAKERKIEERESSGGDDGTCLGVQLFAPMSALIVRFLDGVPVKTRCSSAFDKKNLPDIFTIGS